MIDILGLVGSARAWGNGELLVRQVIRGAMDEGASARLVRLTDLDLRSCTGCMRCAIGKEPCPLDDDLDWLLDTLDAAGGLVLAAPTYFLGPAAVIKLVLDRLLVLGCRRQRAAAEPRPAVTVATAGLEKWRGLVLPFLNAVAAANRYQPIDSLLAVAPGPGEVLLDDALMERAWAAGRRLGRGELEAAPAPDNVCPDCRCEAFVLSGEPSATCPICGRRASVELAGGRLTLRFEPNQESERRWNTDEFLRHIDSWVASTGPRFLANRQEIRTRRAPYRAMQLEWLLPRRPEQT